MGSRATPRWARNLRALGIVLVVAGIALYAITPSMVAPLVGLVLTAVGMALVVASALRRPRR